MNVASRIVVFAAIVGAGGCGLLTDPVTYDSGDLRATVAPPQIALANTSGQRIAYMVIEQDLAARSLFACLVCANSPSIPPSATIKLQYSSIPGYEAGKSQNAIIWWAIVTDADEGPIDPARVQTLVVKL